MLLSCSADAAARTALGEGWCAVVLDEARRGARLPIVPATSDAPVKDARSALTLDVAVRDGAIAIRVARALSIDDAEGSLDRRGPALPPGAAGDPRVRAAFAAAFDLILPWRRAAPSPGVRSRRPATAT